MNPRRPVTDEDAEAIRQATLEREAATAVKQAADEKWRQVILAAADRSSVREAAKVARISPDSITQWRKRR